MNTSNCVFSQTCSNQLKLFKFRIRHNCYKYDRKIYFQGILLHNAIKWLPSEITTSCSYGNLKDSNIQYWILVFSQTLFKFTKRSTDIKWKALGLRQSTYLCDSEITIKSSTWKLLANSSTAVSRNSSTEVRKNNADFYQQRIQIARLGRVHILGSWHLCNRLVISTKSALRPGVVLFVVRLMWERKGSLGAHESQMPIVASSPSESLRCHEGQRKKISQHICFKKCCADGKEKKRTGGWNGLGYHKL